MALHIRNVARHTWRSILRITLLLVITLTMITGMLVGTEGGRISLVKQGLSLVRLWSGLQIDATGIRSPSLRHWEFGQLVVEGISATPRIEFVHLQIDWRWRYAIQNRWWFSQISMQGLNVDMADIGKSGGEQFSVIYDNWTRIPSVRLERLRIDNIEIFRPHYPTLISALDAQAEINWGTLPARFVVGLSDDASGNEYALQLSAESIEQLRLQGSLHAEPGTTWAQWMKWQLPEAAQASWDLKIDYSQPGMLDVRVDQWTMPWQNYVLKADGQIRYDIDDIELHFLPLNFSLDDKPAQLSGWINAAESDLSISVDDWTIDPISQVFGYQDFIGQMSLSGQWLGGWRRPRLDGELTYDGYWRQYPMSLSMTSVAELSSLFISSAQLDFANNDIALNGRINWITDELDFNFEGLIDTDPVLRPSMPALLKNYASTASIRGQITGPVLNPNVQFDVQSQGQWRDDNVQLALQGHWQNAQLTLDNAVIYSPLLQAKGTFFWPGADQPWQSEWQIQELRSELLDRFQVRFPVPVSGAGYGQLSVNGLGGDFSVAGDLNVTGRWQDWPLNAQLHINDLDSQHIELGATDLQLGASRLSGQGSVNWRQHQLDLQLTHQDWPLSSLPPWLKFWPRLFSTLDGAWTGRTDITGLWKQPAIRTDSQLIGRWFNEPIDLTLQTRPDSATAWQIPKLQAHWLDADWQYSGTFQPYQLTVEGDATVDRLHVKHLPLLSREFTGAEKSLPERMNLNLFAHVKLRGRLTQPVVSGTSRFQGELDQLPFELKAQLGYLDTNYVSIDDASGTWAGGKWQLDGLYDWRLQQMAMTFETDTPDASHLVPWLQWFLGNNPQFGWLNQWDGSLVGHFQLDNRTADWLIDADLHSAGQLYDEEYQLHWQGDGRLRQALDHRIEAQWAQAQARGQFQSDAQSVQGAFSLASVDYDKLRQITPTVPDWLQGQVNGDISIDGAWQNPEFTAQLATDGTLAFNRRLPFSAQLNITGNRDQWSLEKTVFDIPNAITVAVSGDGQGTQGDLLFEGVLPDTRYWIDNEEIGPGDGVFNVVASGDLLQPELTGELSWRSENWPINLEFNLATDRDHYRLQSSLYSDDQTRLKTQLVLPVKSLTDWPNQWKTTPLQTSGAINTPLSVLDPFIIDQPDIHLAGEVSGQWQMEGTLTAPHWQGQMAWNKGQFSHANYGALVDDIELTIDAQDTVWQLSAEANDGRNGAVTASGQLQFVPQDGQIFGHNIQMALGFVQAKLLNQAQMDAALNGGVLVNGSYHDLTLSGDVVVTPMTIQTDTFLWDGAPQLNIIDDEALALNALSEQPFYWPQGQWNVNLYATNRANLYGQGISAELTGDLIVTDDLYAPVLAGQFSLVRGTYTGLGRVFQLTSGSVLIQNNQMVLDIQGEHQATMQLNGQRTIVPVTLHITGTRDSLNLALSSDANLDQDELLAQLLFGKIVEDLDVIQAVMLANVVNKLRTGVSGFDIIGATRDSFALDSLVVDTESDEAGNLQFNISAGKYLNDYIYLQVEQDVGQDQEFRGSLQYQVTPNTNLEFYTQGAGGDFNENGVELNWSWDY